MRVLTVNTAMATEFASCSPPMKKSNVRVWGSSIIMYQRPWIHLLLFLVRISTTTSMSSSASQISYSNHCDSIIPKSTPNGEELSPFGFLQLQNGYFTGGDKIIGQNSQSSFSYPKDISFQTRNIFRTDNAGVLKVEGSLVFRFMHMRNITYGRTLHGKRFRHRRPRFPVPGGLLNFRLEGFWSEVSGKLCMVGSGSGYSKEGNLLNHAAVFKLNYPNNSTIFTSLVNGTLESLDIADNSNYFEPISILAYSQRNYNYTLISKENENEFPDFDHGQDNISLSLEPGKSICSVLLNWRSVFELEYESDCDVAKNCSPFSRTKFLPSFMFFNGAQCSDKNRLRLLLMFSNTSSTRYNPPLVPDRTLVGEGAWDGEKNRLFLVACRILNHSDNWTHASVGDCSIRLSLRFPSIFSISNRSVIVGQIGSNSTLNDLGYFDRIVFRSTETRVFGRSHVTYEYTEGDRVRSSCVKKKAVKIKRRRYPSGYSSNMRFEMSVKNSIGQGAWGYSTPFSIGDQFYEHLRSEASNMSTYQSVPLNVSYTISLTIPPNFEGGSGLIMTNASSSSNTLLEISAEGIYDAGTGSLCMVGCRNAASNHGKLSRNASMDCEIFINVEFPPTNAKVGVFVKGTIESTRKNSDPLYFERLELSSVAIYTEQANESIWRMDLEITMVLISNTLACIFVGLQLFYVKKNPDELPFISLVMLVILTLGHMIPLVLNFEALFVGNRNRQNVLLGSGGWLEVNEVIVRIVTMVAFLLQFRLLQLTWSTRSSGENLKGLWISEKKALCVLSSLYLVGGLVALFVHWRNNYYVSPVLHGRLISGYQQHSLLGDMRSYAGLVLDGFLLPQILLNFFSNSKEKALSPSYYVGTTAVRLLPHAYDLYRASKYTRNFDFSSIYANPGADFYSTAWDVIIPCGGLLFAFFVFLQQRFGGRSIVPSRFRGLSVYEKVPVAGGE